jgi:alkylated DNA repair dioxygenase AlkB
MEEILLDPGRQNMLPFDGEAFFYPNFFTQEESDLFMDTLTQEIGWKQEAIRIYGREVMQPRLTAWYGIAGKDYTYSGITMRPTEWTACLLSIKRRIEAVVNVSFTNALLNCYRDGQDSMGWHRDNERELGTNPVIGSVSFGASRTFQFRHYKDKSVKKAIDLTNGSFLCMKGETQHHWEHRVPKTSKEVGSRINLTFRQIL